MINNISDETKRLNWIEEKNADILLGKSKTNIVNCDTTNQPGNQTKHIN